MEGDVAGSKVLLERSRAFIVEYLDFGSVTPVGKVVVQFCLRSYDLLLRSVLDGFRQDGIWIMCKQNHDVFVAPAGGDRKFACLIGTYFTCDLNQFETH